jgi:hypothetical protein
MPLSSSQISCAHRVQCANRLIQRSDAAPHIQLRHKVPMHSYMLLNSLLVPMDFNFEHHANEVSAECVPLAPSSGRATPFSAQPHHALERSPRQEHALAQALYNQVVRAYRACVPAHHDMDASVLVSIKCTPSWPALSRWSASRGGVNATAIERSTGSTAMP